VDPSGGFVLSLFDLLQLTITIADKAIKEIKIVFMSIYFVSFYF